MGETVKPKMRWFLKAGLAVLVCVICIWFAKSELIDIDSVKPLLMCENCENCVIPKFHVSLQTKKGGGGCQAIETEG